MKGEEKQTDMYTVETSDGPVEKAFCQEYFKDKTVSKVLGTAISFIIIAINKILKDVIIRLISAIRHDTYSE